jgi:hypothetical protein
MIGILTFHWADNYGAQLQAYALQKTITKLGYESEFINYCPSNRLQANNSQISVKSVLHSIYRYIYGIGIEQKRKRLFTEFRVNYLAISKLNIQDKTILSNNTLKYNTLITGSDQVWNTRITNNDLTYFLDFVQNKCRKISYAASFGVSSIPQDVVSLITPSLITIDYLSVREKTGASIINSITKKFVNVVLDPTLLLNIDDWSEIGGIQPIFSDPYILCYELGMNQPRMMELCLYLQKTTKIKIVKIGNNRERFNRKYTLVNATGPKEFVNLILNADYIVTNSFHGTALSVNFKKNFYTIPTGGRADGERNSRMVDFLEDIGLYSRLFMLDTFLPEQSTLSINYSFTTSILNERKFDSLKFLASSLLTNEK